MEHMTRRGFLASLPALATASRALAQPRTPAIAPLTLNHMTLSVSDPRRSQEFYQGLFGLPIQARQGNTVLLQIGSGPQFLALGRAAANAKPAINHFCMTTEGFEVDRILRILAGHGVAKMDPPAAGGPAGGGGLSGGPMKVRVRMRGEDAGGAREGTPEIYLGDPDGIVVQLQDASYCGGGGALGSVCLARPEPASRKGPLAVRALSHFTLDVSNQQRSTAFYQEVFGMPIQARQGATPLLAVGHGPQFLALGHGSANSETPGTPGIAHVCLTMEGFDPRGVMKILADFGIKQRSDAAGPVGPLTSYVSLRMEDRGGARGGTPELYFTDPDGILVQLQDVGYCGGSGYLGNVCP
jgi:catechol 2,3-dioxygenase-like lactoylglutathione lyase family enzyme